ncbi:MAG: hypothetical protein A4E52_00493 [Pelotomaculum sp. PtaB.Bin013]|uniref:Carboxypeptidase-like regulatory domain-containing protein n=1 Tax=Pelotomaculum isophthalicicum JI TaxID=947010 RepID=A0A9X4H200_9FIRM|nr:carboxypeptidase-like regulatory domain-containing protein [Pelotomaculum isophthalicicum]MDF9408490.1 carboxypeptidase-like regulatory domain-containing protein [Pelotomaculum isophthalicicum JI]OPX91498.1 MAG: hypothetical protein A4E52_00493 [Pelotomaculum sp. PtaB.Bin013]
MKEQTLTTNNLVKLIKWTRSVDVTIPVSNVEIFQRVEKINTFLMENAILQVQIFIKLFALTSSKEENKANISKSTVFTKDVEINTLIELNNEITKEDIVSLDHQVNIEKYYPRPDSIVVNGTMKITITYIEHLTLSGTVINFLNRMPIAGATINIRNLDSDDILASAKTNSKGLYSFNNLPPGVFLLEAITEFHKPEQKISVIKNKDIVNFVLHS